MIAGLGRMWRFVKVEHTLFSLPLLFAGAWLGAGRAWPAWQTLLWIAMAGVGARALGGNLAQPDALDGDVEPLGVHQREHARQPFARPADDLGLGVFEGELAGRGPPGADVADLPQDLEQRRDGAEHGDEFAQVRRGAEERLELASRPWPREQREEIGRASGRERG